MSRSQYQWVYSPKKPAPPKVPEALKRRVAAEANALIETVLRPLHIQPPPEDPQFNYLVDLSTKWFRSYFYFCSRYAVSGPHAIVPFFDDRFARLEYIGGDRFNLAAMRHNGEWIEIFPDLSLDECLAAVRDDPWFHP
jgi:hypothetical protein